MCYIKTYALAQSADLQVDNTCKKLEVAFAKYPLLLWCFRGEYDCVQNSPVVQSVHKPHCLCQHQFSYK